MRPGRWLLAAVLALLPAWSAAAPADLTGVGLIDLGTVGGCTGALIAPDLVLTAAHCLRRRDGDRLLDAEEFVFAPTTPLGMPAEGFRGRKLMVHPIYDLIPAGRQRERYDLGLIALERPVPADLARPLAFAPPGTRVEKGFVMSFRGRGSGRARQKACEVLERREGTLVGRCAVDQGESGAPLLVPDGEAFAILGVVVAKGTVGRIPTALIVDLDRAGPSLLEAWRMSEGG